MRDVRTKKYWRGPAQGLKCVGLFSKEINEIEGARDPAVGSRGLREQATASLHVEQIGYSRIAARGEPLSRALRSNNFWLAITYVGLIVLMARVYA
jgi:hypothetical protein